MSKIIDFPKPPTTETINQAFFEKFADAALLLKCFECVKDAAEFVEEGGVIQERDDMYVGLIEAYWALKVLFERRTGADALIVSNEHWTAASESLLAGEESPPMLIPTGESLTAPLPPEYFSEHSDLALACTAFNSSDQIRLGANATLAASNAAISATVAVEAINATTVLRLLVLRMSGGTVESMGEVVSKLLRPNGETLQ
ncbi:MULTISPECIES: hypothetical protein [unclassified Pseudomonas]|uniref:hypothetical protein n=1 Tax=unclassified Pseudomonas TaxID=196821 RepID=UPI001CBBF481|nr:MULTISPECIES: hypothetical protein [unclassified Pseudomonas]